MERQVGSAGTCHSYSLGTRFEVPLREAGTRCDMFEAEEGSSLLDTPFECQTELGSDKAPPGISLPLRLDGYRGDVCVDWFGHLCQLTCATTESHAWPDESPSTSTSNN